MVVKVYVSGISGNQEVKKRQQRVLMILDSKSIKYDVIDITEPGKEDEKEFMQNNATSNGGTVSDPNPRSALPPQVFNDDEYCGDYDQFDMANEVDTLEQFLKVEAPPEEPPQTDTDKDNAVNGDIVKENKDSKENSQEREENKEDAPSKDKSVSKEGTPARDSTPAKEGTPTKEGTPAREGTPAKAGTPKSGSVTREATPAKEVKAASKEPSPAKDVKEPSPAKEKSPEKDTAKEPSPERAKSVDKEEKEKSPEKVTELESKKQSKENSPEKDVVNENGSVSSRGQSQEKGAGDKDSEIVESKKDPSEALIVSEQTAAAE